MIPGIQNIWLSLLKYVKIRRTLVQLKQSKKIKPLSECNFPYFTLECKYQRDKSSFHLKTAHNFLQSFFIYLCIVRCLSSNVLVACVVSQYNDLFMLLVQMRQHCQTTCLRDILYLGCLRELKSGDLLNRSKSVLFSKFGNPQDRSESVLSPSQLQRVMPSR